MELQGGDPSTRALWERVVAVSADAFSATYAHLGVRLRPGDVVGGSCYQDRLQRTVDDLDALGLLQVSDGAVCAFLPGLVPLVLRSSTGGSGTTRRTSPRCGTGWSPTPPTGSCTSSMRGRVCTSTRCSPWHVAFGTVLGTDGRPFKTRDGGTVPLGALLEEAEQQAGSRDVGIGAVKYADLSCGLGRDYVFDLERMTALDGDTGPYLQYAHARLATLLARAGEVPGTVEVLQHPAELRVAFALTQFPGVVQEVARTLEPHRLCGYLHRLAVAVSAFYEACPVLRAEEPVRSSRLTLCAAARRTLATGLDLLGIAAPDAM